jgi:N6-adenosine-specific RNA methylase IME4
MRRAKDVRRLVVEKRREHSRKPEFVRDRIERLVAGLISNCFPERRRSGSRLIDDYSF